LKSFGISNPSCCASSCCCRCCTVLSVRYAIPSTLRSTQISCLSAASTAHPCWRLGPNRDRWWNPCESGIASLYAVRRAPLGSLSIFVLGVLATELWRVSGTDRAVFKFPVARDQEAVRSSPRHTSSSDKFADPAICECAVAKYVSMSWLEVRNALPAITCTGSVKSQDRLYTCRRLAVFARLTHTTFYLFSTGHEFIPSYTIAPRPSHAASLAREAV
jgi:hypothetical protein